jgi:hypothetical protein
MNLDEYVNKELYNKNFKINLQDITNYINNNKKIIVTKFGDGEYFCMNRDIFPFMHENCDGDKFSNLLVDELKKAFVELCNDSVNDNIYLGKWCNNSGDKNKENVSKYMISLLYNYNKNNNKPLISIPYIYYDIITLNHNFNNNSNCKYNCTNIELYNFVKSIQNSNKKKIIITCKKNYNHKKIFKGDFFIEIPENSWYYNGYFNILIDNIEKIINDNKCYDCIILISAGLASKIVINDLRKKYNNITFLDIGSGFDYLSQGTITRGDDNFYKFNYNDLYNYFKDLLGDNYTTPFNPS